MGTEETGTIEIKKFVEAVDVDVLTKTSSGEGDKIDSDETLPKDREYCEKAANSYLQYPCYCNKDGWEKSGPKRKRYVIKNDSIGLNAGLNADIITSIKTPIKVCLTTQGGDKIGETFKGKNGKYIKSFLLCNDCNEFMNNKGITPYLKAFAIVYYWYGNMMPVLVNPMLRYNDNWFHKLLVIEQYFKWLNHVNHESSEKSLKFIDFIEGNFFQDVYDEGKVMLKPVIEIGKNEKINKDVKLGCVNETVFKDVENVKQWFLNNTKIIIQRSYRIYWEGQKNSNPEQVKMRIQYDNKDKQKSFTDKGKKEIQEIFKHVFQTAGFKEDFNNENTTENNFLKIF